MKCVLAPSVAIFTARNEVGARLCFYTFLGMVSQHALQVVSQHALQQVSRGCVVSQHALQVSRPTPGGREFRGLAWGVSRPHPGVSRPTFGGVSRPTPRGELSQHALRQPLQQTVRILME